MYRFSHMVFHCYLLKDWWIFILSVTIYDCKNIYDVFHEIQKLLQALFIENSFYHVHCIARKLFIHRIVYKIEKWIKNRKRNISKEDMAHPRYREYFLRYCTFFTSKSACRFLRYVTFIFHPRQLRWRGWKPFIGSVNTLLSLNMYSSENIHDFSQ